MKGRFLRLLALMLALMLLSGCGMVDFEGYLQGLGEILGEGPRQDSGGISFSGMEYRRPELAELQDTLQRTLEAAKARDVRTAMDGVYEFYDGYDWFYTCLCLADLHYSGDLRDSYWAEEYRFCSESSAAVDALLEELYYGLAASPIREQLEDPKFFGPDFFDGYEGENPMDGTLAELLEQEAVLESRYYTLSEETLDYETGSQELYDACGDDLAALLVELIQIRQQIAAYLGYDSYTAFAWDYYYDRDYTPQQVQRYLGEIRQELVPLYRAQGDSPHWDTMYAYCSEARTMDYLRSCAKAMGGTVEEAFQMMEQRELYDTRYSENKYNSSFELYLTSYAVPFVFMNPELSRYDCLTLVHEFGHFCNDYASYGSYADIDVAEVFSQGMEYLSLCYCEEGAQMTPVKMLDSLALYVEQAAYGEFEMRMYALTGDDLSAQGLYDLYDEVAESYGFDAFGWDSREFVETVHFYTHPMYVVSYVLSNDAALQLYEMELQEPGAGKALYEANLATPCTSLLSFLESAGLDSPFAPGRMAQVRQILETALR